MGKLLHITLIGKVQREETFQNALVNGAVKSYSENGILEYEANYKNDKKMV